MKQTKALYCLNVGFLHGARLDKTNNYDLANGGYSFKAPFTPITFVKLSDINQPVHCSGETYIFGFSPQDMYRIASLTKKDLEDALVVELNRINTTKKKLQSAWEKVAAAVTTEQQAVERTGGPPPVPSTSQRDSVAPAVLPSPSQEETPPPAETPAPEAPKPPESKQPPAEEKPKPPENKPAEQETTGTVTRGVQAFNVYVASARAKASKTEGSQSIGYCAFIKNLQNGEITEISKAGHTYDFGKMIVLALCEAFEAGIIPPSTKGSSTVTTIYTSNEFIAKMFSKNFLRSFAKNGWKKKDGGDLANKDEWSRVWNHASHMVAKGVVCEPDSEELKACTEKAQAHAEADYTKRYGLIGPGGSK